LVEVVQVERFHALLIKVAGQSGAERGHQRNVVPTGEDHPHALGQRLRQERRRASLGVEFVQPRRSPRRAADLLPYRRQPLE
jgi:hypothetical protein